jgi:hypothetical protein
MKKYLQVKTEAGWRYLFCLAANGPDRGRLVTTDTRTKALPWFHIDFFCSKFADHEFRVEPLKTR